LEYTKITYDLYAIEQFAMKNEARLFGLAVAGFNRYSIKSESQKDGRIQLELNKSVKDFWDSIMFGFLAIGSNRKSLVTFFPLLYLKPFCGFNSVPGSVLSSIQDRSQDDFHPFVFRFTNK
jgi:hypothetical protein